MEKKNILLVLADQWRAQSLGYAGCDDVQTPQLDRFAAESCNLSHAISSCPVCTPTRASLLTGLYPNKHGLFLNDAPLNPELPSFGKQFRDMGYDTAWVGKWHVDGNGRAAYIPPERRQGFDYWKVLECTHDYNNSRYYANDSDEITVWPEYDARAQTDDMIAWLKQRSQDRPFCAVLSWGPPHSPYQTAPEEFKALYDPATLTIPANVPEDKIGKARENLAGYYAHCSALDTYFGDLLACIDKLGVKDDTIVMFTSDHGDFIGAHGMYDKQGPWDEAIRIPCLIRSPGQLTPGENKSLFNLTDFWPTVNGLLGLSMTDIQGRDWSEYLIQQSTPDDNYALYACYHVFGNWPAQGKIAGPLYEARESRGIRDLHFTYVEDLKGPWLFYDNDNDPLQMNNLVDSEEHAALRQQYAQTLHAHLKTLGDEFKPGMNYVNVWGYQVKENGTIGTEDFK